jgi:hypothetical protein
MNYLNEQLAALQITSIKHVQAREAASRKKAARV